LAGVRRIARMSQDEIRLRALQAVRKRLDETRYRFTGRVHSPASFAEPRPPGRFFFDSPEAPNLARLLQERMPEQAAAIISRAESIRRHRYDVLGFTDLDLGSPIDWHRDVVHDTSAPRVPWFRVPYLNFDAVGDHKILWELNRHQHLVILAKAAILTEEAEYVSELVEQWYHWRAENPYPIGINWASSLEVAFRALSWLWILQLLGARSALPSGFVEDVQDALALSAWHIDRYLSTYFAPNTHLLGEAVALFFIGVLCPQYRAASRWRAAGWDIVQAEARRQVRSDGMHFEQSTYYHVYALDFFLHARLLASNNEMSIPSGFDAVLRRMAEVLHGLSLDGALPRLGDDDGGRVFDGSRNRFDHLLDPLVTCAALFDRGDWKEAAGGLREEALWLVGEEGVERFDRLEAGVAPLSSLAFSDSGLYSLAQPAPVSSRLIVDAGPHGMGSGAHGHADSLSVNLLLGGRQCLGDPGTYSYSDAGPARNAYRGTAAHNTMRVDGLDQGEPGGPFAWETMPSCRVERWVVGKTVDVFVGSHDGYRRLPNPVTHRRWVVSWRRGLYFIRDRAAGSGAHSLEIFWHVGPDFTVSQDDAHRITLSAPGHTELMLATSSDMGWSRVVRQAEWSPAYGVKVPASVVCYGLEARLPAELATVLIPQPFRHDTGADTITVQTVPCTEALTVYRVVVGHLVTTLWFPHSSGPWRSNAFASDAECLFHTWDESRAVTSSLVVVGGSYVEFENETVLRCGRSVDVWEWWHEDGEETITCSDPSAVLESGAAVQSLPAHPTGK
jgi:hypothetical protein